MIPPYQAWTSLSLTVSLASLPQEQFDDAKEALGCGQVKRPVSDLPTHVHICSKLQQQLCHLKQLKHG